MSTGVTSGSVVEGHVVSDSPSGIALTTDGVIVPVKSNATRMTDKVFLSSYVFPLFVKVLHYMIS